MYVYTYIHTHIHIYIYIIYIYTRISAYTLTPTTLCGQHALKICYNINQQTCVCMYIYIYIFIHMCVHAYIYICIYVRIQTHTHTHTPLYGERARKTCPSQHQQAYAPKFPPDCSAVLSPASPLQIFKVIHCYVNFANMQNLL